MKYNYPRFEEIFRNYLSNGCIDKSLTVRCKWISIFHLSSKELDHISSINYKYLDTLRDIEDIKI